MIYTFRRNKFRAGLRRSHLTRLPVVSQPPSFLEEQTGEITILFSVGAGFDASSALRANPTVDRPKAPFLFQVPANVLKIDHVLCDHHERVIRRAVRRSENTNPGSAGEQPGPPIAEAKCIVSTLRDIKPEADCIWEPVGSKQAELFSKHDSVMLRGSAPRTPKSKAQARGGINALWRNYEKDAALL
jgi:hypothetical protein